jgi:predicted acetyltransferase
MIHATIIICVLVVIGIVIIAVIVRRPFVYHQHDVIVDDLIIIYTFIKNGIGTAASNCLNWMMITLLVMTTIADMTILTT